MVAVNSIIIAAATIAATFANHIPGAQNSTVTLTATAVRATNSSATRYTPSIIATMPGPVIIATASSVAARASSSAVAAVVPARNITAPAVANATVVRAPLPTANAASALGAGAGAAFVAGIVALML